MLKQSFQSPDAWARGTDFWMLNDKLEEDELRRQLQGMSEQGVGSVIVRTYVGLSSDYPGPDWMKKMHIVVNEARRLGIKLFMQAGYMPEAVLNLPEAFSLGDIRAYKGHCEEGEKLDENNGIEYRLVPTRTILDMLDKDACAFYVLQSYENMWKDFKDEFGKTIISMWVDEPSFAKTSLPWTRRLPEKYSELWNEVFPYHKIHLLFTDGEGDKLFRLRYWRTVLYLLKNSYFKSVCDWGKANGILFSGHLMQEDYMETQIFSTAFTMPLYKYFDIPGMDFLTAEMNWRHGRIRPENPFNYQWSRNGSYVTPLQCTSAAHQAGQNVILAEMYGVSTENMGFRDQKHMFDHFASLGVNHRSVHGIFYSLGGRGKRAFPPHVNSYQPYWPKYRCLTDTIARESAFLRAGKPEKDILLLHPIETGFSLFHGKTEDGVRHNEALRRYDAGFCQIVRSLVGMQANFELGDEDTIAEMGSVSADGRFVVGEISYSTVILPEMKYIRSTTLELLKAFISAGGRIAVLNSAPHTLDTGEACSKEALEGAVFVNGTRQLQAFLESAPRLWWFERRADDTGVQILCRRDGEDLLFFIANGDCSRPMSGNLAVSGLWGAECFEPACGSISPFPSLQSDGVTRLPVQLTEGGSLMLRVSTSLPTSAPKPLLPQVHLPLNPEWRFRREDPNALVLERFRFGRGAAVESKRLYPLLGIQDHLVREKYTGDVTLETDFILKKPMKGLKLSAEHPEQQTFLLDGKPLLNSPDGSYLCFAFETLPLPDLTAGKHTITVHRHFEPMKKATSHVTSLFENLGGVQLEHMLLIGDFAVKSAIEPAIEGCVRLHEDFVLTQEDCISGNDLISRGYPFYAGRMLLETEFELDDASKNLQLSMEGLNAALAEVFVNGKNCGLIGWPPYTLPLTGLVPGRNTLSVRLYGTLRNLLGPWHRPVGEIGACWGGYETPDQPWLGCFAHENGKRYEDWLEDRIPDRPGWTESYLLVPFGIIRPELIGDV
ncbi:MAG: hypothetical protein IJC48_10635 [Clostridia bacterium]|nr:hypothetical protein [Clostridia bacterium]